ncbi:MAG: Hsp20/alpha crystallin family protein [Polyangiales bacterium]
MTEQEAQAAPPEVDTSSSPASPANPIHRAWRAALLVIVGLLVVTVGVEAWFLRDLRQETATLKEQLSDAVPTTDWSQGNSLGAARPQALNPFAEMQRMRDEMNRAFGGSMNSMNLHPSVGSATSGPSVDLREEPDRFIVQADVPGASAGSVKVYLDRQQLTIEATRESQTEQKTQSGRVLREEREAGVLSRTLTLPEPVSPSGMKTDVQDGVLTITIPKLAHG